jgi:hypothetical protein
VFGLVDQQGRLEEDEDEKEEAGEEGGVDDAHCSVAAKDDDSDDEFWTGNPRSPLLSGSTAPASDSEAAAQVLYLKAPSHAEKVQWIEQLQQLCSRTFNTHARTRVQHARWRESY